MSEYKAPLLQALDEAESGKAPSPFGEIEVVIPGAPVSVQSTKAVRTAYLARVKAELTRYKFVLTGQLILDVTWLLPTKSRYETDAKSDIDNCIKPILDAFTGPEGLFIDDCQLKGLYICWRHIESGEERLVFQFKFDADQWCERSGLAFLKLGSGLCCPVNTTWPKPLREGWIEAMKQGTYLKSALADSGFPYLALAPMTGGSQPFHISRTRGFQVFTYEEFIRLQDA